MSKPDELTGLIADASAAIDQLEAGAKPAPKRRKAAGPLALLIPLLLAPIAFVSLLDRNTLGDLSNAAVETQLIAILRSAQTSLNAITGIGKPLPPVLPNASLAGIVTYQVNGNYYTLTIESNGLVVTLDALGNITSNIDQLEP